MPCCAPAAASPRRSPTGRCRRPGLPACAAAAAGRREEGKGVRKEGKGSHVGEDDGGDQDEADLDETLGVIETDPHLAAAVAAVDAANRKSRADARRRAIGTAAPGGAGSAGLRSRLGRGRAVSTTGAPWSSRPAACRRRWRRRSPPRPGTRSNRCSTRRGSAACSPPRCCANAARPAGTCRACMPG